MLRDELGTEFQLRADANRAWDMQSALAFALAAKSANLEVTSFMLLFSLLCGRMLLDCFMPVQMVKIF